MFNIVLFSGYFINNSELCGLLGLDKESDEEIIVSGFHKWGTSFLRKLNGLFSFVLKEEDSDRYYCCRDRFGGKGLYYTFGRDGAPVFSDTVADLLRHDPGRAAFNDSLLEVYLSYSYIPGEDTVFKGIHKPLPGYCYCFEGGNVSKERYFTPVFRTEKRAESEWEALLADALDSVFKSKEKGGTSLLSSGIDSSYLCERLAVKDTYTAAYEIGNYSEAETAAVFSRKIGARSHTVTISPEEYLASVPETMRALEQPSGDASAPVLLTVCRAIKQETDRCYSGEGIDELFYGYYMDDIRAVPSGKTLAEAEYIGTTYALTEKDKQRFLRHYTATKKMEYVREAYTLSENEDRLRQAALVDLLVWLNGNLLPNIYAAGGKNGLSVHTPYMDNRLYDLALRMPSSVQNDAALTKKLFRKAAGRMLDHETAGRPKRGFPVPIRLWVRRPDYIRKIKHAFTSDTAFRFFNCGELTAFYDRLLSDPEDMDSWRVIWCVYCFIVWYDELINPCCPTQRWQVYDERFNKEEAWSRTEFPGCDWNYMKQAGCLVTSLATALVMNGLAEPDEDVFNPFIFNSRLKAAGLFDQNADLELNKLETLYPLRYLEEIDWSPELLENAMDEGFICLLCVPGVHGAFHYVVPTEITDGDVRIIDSGWNNEYLSDFSKCFFIELFRRTDREPGISGNDHCAAPVHAALMRKWGLTWEEYTLRLFPGRNRSAVSAAGIV